jgi:hypothetical protein
MTPTHTDPQSSSHPADGLDRLLSDFFKNEMPRPWPGPPPHAVAEPSALVRDRTDAGSRSRYTLAASVAVLLGLGVYLSANRPADPANRGPGDKLLRDADADGRKMLPKPNPMPGEHNPMSVPNMP